MPELEADLRGAVAAAKIDDPRHGLLLGVVIEAGAGGRDSPFGLDARHFRKDDPGAAHGELSEMHDVPVAHQALDG